MAITTTPLGSNSASIVYDAGTALGDLMTAVENYITAHGWSVYDAAAGTNAIGYRAANADAASYKYVVLDYNTANRVLSKVYESWDSGTHTGTNLCSYSDDPNYNQKIDLVVGATLYVFCTARWLILWSYVGGAYGSATGPNISGVVEIRRELAEDTAASGYPPYGSVHILSGSSLQVPRLRNGTTGSLAYYSPYSLWGNFNAIPSASNPWNSKYYVTDLYGYNSTSKEYRGLYYGLKGYAQSQGGAMDDMTLVTDADYKLTASGSAVSFWLLTVSATYRVLIPK